MSNTNGSNSSVNIWTQMSYTPPCGPCSQKTGLINSCPCHRFMVHPLKANTSFECDGCGHHASFHRMESSKEDREAAARRLTNAPCSPFTRSPAQAASEPQNTDEDPALTHGIATMKASLERLRRTKPLEAERFIAPGGFIDDDPPSGPTKRRRLLNNVDAVIALDDEPEAAAGSPVGQKRKGRGGR